MGMQCPTAVVDLTLAFPEEQTPSVQQITNHFLTDFPSADQFPVEVLSVLTAGELPLMATGRRLSSGSTEVTVRIGVNDHSPMLTETVQWTKQTAQTAAMSLADNHGGSIAHS